MKKQTTILIADRNPHVREFLKREMASEGYTVRLAKNAQEVHDRIYQSEDLDLVILDPDLPGKDKTTVLTEIQDRVPSLPLVLHMFASENNTDDILPADAVYVEKSGTSILYLKQIVADLLLTPAAAGKPAAED